MQVHTAAERYLEARLHVHVKITSMKLSVPMPIVLIWLFTPFSNDHEWWVSYFDPSSVQVREIVLQDKSGNWQVVSQ
jgi:hypothetical protein